MQKRAQCSAAAFQYLFYLVKRVFSVDFRRGLEDGFAGQQHRQDVGVVQQVRQSHERYV